MTFLAIKWNVDTGWKPIQIICLTIFFVLLISSLFLLVKLIIYKNILRNLTIASKEAEKIARNSLQNRLKRIDDVVTQTPNSVKKNALLVWRTEYKILIEKKFLEQTSFIQKAFALKKVTHPTLINLRQTKKCLNELQLISQKIYLIYRQTDKVMDLEMLQRDTRIKVRAVFADLKQDLAEVLKNPNFNFNRQKMLEKKDNINQALKAINLKIIEGNNTVAEIYQQKTNEQIFTLIQLLDLFYQAEKLLNNVLPTKITKIEQRMRNTILEPKELKKKLNKLYTLREVFELYKKQVFESLANLDYHSSFQKMSYISELVSNFENDIQYEEKIKDFMIDHLMGINKIFEGLKLDLDNVKASLIYNKKLGKNVDVFANQFADLQKQSQTLVRDWEQFYLSWSDINLYRKEFSFTILEDLLKKLLGDLKVVYQGLIEISRSLKTKNNLREEIDTKLFELQAILATTEVAITKSSDHINCEKQKAKVDQVYQQLDAMIKHSDYQNNRLNLKAASLILLNLDKLIEEALEIKTEVRNRVLIAILAENLILYLDRYLVNQNALSNFETLINHYEKNEWNDVLNLGIYHLQTYRK